MDSYEITAYAKLNLFLVDDYLLTRISNKRELENNPDFKVLGDYSSAKECILALENHSPDIILMDIEFPDMNGIEACRIIKEKYPKIKVIMLTSYDDSAKILASLACGACGYIIKGKTDISYAINAVAQGSFLIDLELANNAFSKITAPDTKNLENLYKYEELKHNLTHRELEVLELIIEGKTNSQIAKDIYVSTNTAKAHVGSILEKFGVQDRVQAAVMAVRANLF